MLRLSKISCIAFGGWVAGLATERYLQLKSEEKLPNVESIFDSSNVDIIPKPGLPIFGTVSAATLIPKSQDAQPIPAEPPIKAPRVSQVFYFLLVPKRRNRFISIFSFS